MLKSDLEETALLVHVGWNALDIPIESSSAGVAVAVPAGTIELLPSADGLVSEETNVELGFGIGESGDPSGESAPVRFAIWRRSLEVL